MPYPFTGSDARTYPQYRDLATDRPLTASPGGTYDLAPCGSYVLPVPPGDGNWAPVLPPAPDPDPAIAAPPKAADAPAKTVPKIPAASAEAP